MEFRPRRCVESFVPKENARPGVLARPAWRLWRALLELLADQQVDGQASFWACCCCWNDCDVPLSLCAIAAVAPIATAPATMYLISIAAMAAGRNLNVW